MKKGTVPKQQGVSLFSRPPRTHTDLGIESLLLEGGSEVHAAAWDEDLVDLVSIYVCPRVIGPGGVRFLGGRAFDPSALIDRREERLGPDTLIEGYVHGPR